MSNKIYKNLSRFKLITFDITDTLLKFKTHPSVEYSKVAKEYGYKIDESKIMSSFRTSFIMMSEKYPNFGSKTNLHWSEWWSKLVFDVFKQSHPEMDTNHMREIAKILIKKYETSDCWMKFNECDHKLLKTIKSLNKTVGVISNFDERIEIILKNMNFIEYFNFILSSYSVGFMKPNKQIFDEALKKCPEIVKPNEALHIGNTAKLDYLGAKNAGWNCILINGKSQDIDSNHVFNSIDHFYNVLKTDSIKW